jgi:hypothetical protein
VAVGASPEAVERGGLGEGLPETLLSALRVAQPLSERAAEALGVEVDVAPSACVGVPTGADAVALPDTVPVAVIRASVAEDSGEPELLGVPSPPPLALPGGEALTQVVEVLVPASAAMVLVCVRLTAGVSERVGESVPGRGEGVKVAIESVAESVEELTGETEGVGVTVESCGEAVGQAEGLGVEEGEAEGEGVAVLLPCPEALMLGEAVKEVEAVALGVPLRVRLETGEADTLPVVQPEGPPVRLPLLLRVPTGAVKETLEVAVRVGLAEVV